MVERLVGAARHAALRELHGWSEVEDRDAMRAARRISSSPVSSPGSATTTRSRASQTAPIR